MPPGLTIDTQTGLIHGAIDWSATGSYNVTVSAYNCAGSSVSFTWNVSPEVLTLDPILDQDNTADDTVSLQLSAHSPNPAAIRKGIPTMCARFPGAAAGRSGS